MQTHFITTPDQMKIAYDCSGAGPALILVHGGGGSRKEWHAAGYVERLRGVFTVITLDLRGHGESSLPVQPGDYTLSSQIQDILAVADACGFEKFFLWAMSYGGNISRYLAAQSTRVTKAVLMGTRMGLGVPDAIRQDVKNFCKHWSPILQAQNDGKLDIGTLSPDDQDFLHGFNVPVIMAWGQAMLDWSPIQPADIRCPTLWLIGSEDRQVIDSYQDCQPDLDGSLIQGRIMEGFDHGQVFDEIDQVFPILFDFTRS